MNVKHQQDITRKLKVLNHAQKFKKFANGDNVHLSKLNELLSLLNDRRLEER